MKNVIWLNESYEKTENLKFLDFALVTGNVIKVLMTSSFLKYVTKLFSLLIV